MKKYLYNVRGLTSSEACERAVSAISSALPEARDVVCSLDDSSVSFALSASSRYAEQRLSGALAVVGLELVLPEGVKKYRFIGEKKRSVAKIPVAVAMSIIALVCAASVLFTFVSCEYLNRPGNQSNVGNSGATGTPIDQGAVNELEIPQYIKDLIKLDDAFNDYSYDGLDEETISAAMLKAYIAATGDMYAEYRSSLSQG